MRKPSEITIAGILLLLGGIVALFTAMVTALFTLGLYLPWMYSFVAACTAIYQGARLLGDVRGTGVSIAAPVMLICNAINCDFISMVLGIVTLCLLRNQGAQRYLRGEDLTTGQLGEGYGYVPGAQGHFSSQQRPVSQSSMASRAYGDVLSNQGSNVRNEHGWGYAPASWDLQLEPAEAWQSLPPATPESEGHTLPESNPSASAQDVEVGVAAWSFLHKS